MKIKRVIAEILALVLFINTLSITTLAENEAQDFIEAVEQEHIEPIMDQWGETAVIQEEAPAENTDGQITASPENETPADQWGEGAALSEGAPDENADDGITEDAAEVEAPAEGEAEAAAENVPAEGDTPAGEAAAEEVSAEEVIEEAVIAEAEVVEAEAVEAVAAEAAKEEASEATPSEAQESAGSVMLGEGNVPAGGSTNNDNAEASVNDGTTTYYFDTFANAIAYAEKVGTEATASVVTLKNVAITASQLIKCTPSNAAKLVLDLNGKTISGSVDGYILDLQHGDITIIDSSADETNKSGIGMIKNTSASGNVMNIGSGDPTVTLDGGNYIANGNPINAYGGKLYVEPGKLPYIESINANAIKNDHCIISLAGGIYSSKPAEGMLRKRTIDTEPNYEAYYVQAKQYYVVMEKHPIYLRGTTEIQGKEADMGFDTLTALTAEIDARAKVSTATQSVYLMEQYPIPADEVNILLAENCRVLFDLYGQQLTGMVSMRIPDTSSLTITDTLIGGFIHVPGILLKVHWDGTKYVIVYQEDGETPALPNLTLEGGSYDSDPARKGVLELLLPYGYILVENVFGGKTYYTVVKSDNCFLVPGKGSALTFEAAMAIAEDGDTVAFIKDMEGVTTQFAVNGKNVLIDINGKKVSTINLDNVFYVTGGAAATIKDSVGRGLISMNYSSHPVICADRGSAVILEGVVIEHNSLKSGTCVSATDGATITVKDCSLKGPDVLWSTNQNSEVVLDGTTTINGDVSVGTGAKLTIKKGEYQDLSFYEMAGMVKVEGGTFNGPIGITDSQITARINIQGGYFKADPLTTSNSQNEYLYVYAGDFVADPTPYLAPGYYTTVLPSGHFSATRPKFSTINTRIDSEIYLRVTTGVKTTDPQRTGDKPMEMMILFEDLSANREPYTALVPVDTTETVPSAKHLLYPQCMADKYQLTLFVHNPNVTQRQTTDARIVDGKTFSPVQTYNSMNMVEDGIINHPKKKTDFSLRTLFTSTMPLEDPDEALANGSVPDADKIKHLYASFLSFAACNQRYHTDQPTDWSLITKDPGWCDNGYADEILVWYDTATQTWQDIVQAKFDHNEKPMGNSLQWTWTYGYPGETDGYPTVPKATSDSADHPIFKSYSLTIGSHFAVKFTLDALDKTKMDTDTYDYQAVITCEDDDYKQYYAATTIPLKIESGVCTFSYPVYYPELQRLFKFDIQKAEKGTENWASVDCIVRSVENFLYEYENRAGADEEKGSRNVFYYRYPNEKGIMVYEDEEPDITINKDDGSAKASGNYYYPLRIRKLVQSVFEFGVSCYQYRKYYKGY